MLGTNPKRPIMIGDGTNLEVKKIFKTIQGEGPFSGAPAIFVRLGGCNLACKFCDTDFEDFNSVNINDILQEITKLNDTKSIKLVVITGGEPFRQPIELLCEKLLEQNFRIQIETNGTLYRELPKEISIICSPKASSLGYSMIREDLLENLSAIKFIVSKTIVKYSSIAEIGQTKYNIPVFIQPIDQNEDILNKENMDLAVEIAMKYGYNLSLQIHKILGLE